MSVRDNQNETKRNYTLLYEIEKCNADYGNSYDKEITLNDNPSNYKYVVCHTSCYDYSSKKLKHTETRIIPTCLLTNEHIPFCVLTAIHYEDHMNACITINTTTAARIVGSGTNFLISYKIYGTNVL